MKGEKFKVSKALIAEGLKRERSDIKWMEKRLGQSLDEVIDDDGTEIASEEDLLQIKQASCAELAAIFCQREGVTIPAEVIPVSDPVTPEAAALMVEACRMAYKEKVEKRMKLNQVTKFFPRPLRRLWKFSKRVLSGTPRQPA
jgi:hypothetical protein